MRASDLRRPVREVAARHALALLGTCRRRAGLGAELHEEALHDYRVALRRLRTWLREFHRPLGLPRQDEPLRRAARLTGPARDRQVVEALLAEAAGREPGRARARSRREAAALRRDWSRARAGVAAAAPELVRLRTQLSAPAGARGREPFGRYAGARVLKRVRALERRVSRLGGRPDGPKAHRARIAGKRLRYLLEPLPGSGPLVRELKQAQDRLGLARDLRLLVARAAKDGPRRARVSAWARRRAREEGSEYRRALTGRRGRAFFRSVRRFAGGLGPGGRG